MNVLKPSILKLFFILSFCAISKAQELCSESAAAGSYEQLSAEVKNHIFSFIGIDSTLPMILQDVNACRRINRESNSLLSNQQLLQKILLSAVCWRKNIDLGVFEVPLHGIVHIYIDRETGRACLAIPPHQHCSYLYRLYTHEEVQAVVSFIVRILRNLPCERSYFKQLLMLIRFKALFLNWLIVEAEEFYSCQFLGANIVDARAFFSWRSLHMQNRLQTDLVPRFEKFKLLIPFYIEMLKHGHVPLSLPTLIRSQVQEFGDFMLDSQQRLELLAIIKLLAPLEYDPIYRYMYESYSKELEIPPLKRQALEN